MRVVIAATMCSRRTANVSITQKLEHSARHVWRSNHVKMRRMRMSNSNQTLRNILVRRTR